MPSPASEASEGERPPPPGFVLVRATCVGVKGKKVIFDSEAAGRLRIPVSYLGDVTLPKPGDVVDLELPQDVVVWASLPWYMSRYPWGWLLLLAVGGLAWWMHSSRH
jgi:hypothetical protein